MAAFITEINVASEYLGELLKSCECILIRLIIHCVQSGISSSSSAPPLIAGAVTTAELVMVGAEIVDAPAVTEGADIKVEDIMVGDANTPEGNRLGALIVALAETVGDVRTTRALTVGSITNVVTLIIGTNILFAAPLFVITGSVTVAEPVIVGIVSVTSDVISGGVTIIEDEIIGTVIAVPVLTDGSVTTADADMVGEANVVAAFKVGSNTTVLAAIVGLLRVT
jgi:hypothetical protein